MTDHASSNNDASNAPPDWDAIARFLAGESSAAEAAGVSAWLAAHPADRDLVERLGEAATLPVTDVDVESALRRVHSRMTEEGVAPRLTVVRGTGPRWRRSFVVPAVLTTAAAAVV